MGMNWLVVRGIIIFFWWKILVEIFVNLLRVNGIVS